jgi:hypothetical protein
MQAEIEQGRLLGIPMAVAPDPPFSGFDRMQMGGGALRSLHRRSWVGGDGILHLSIPAGCRDAEVEVTVLVEPVVPPVQAAGEPPGWSEDFFREVVGGWQGGPLVREPQGQYETRAQL